MLLPTGRVEVLKLALPPDKFAVPKTTEPEVKVTVPVGVVVGDVTVAVNFTVWPAVEGFREEATVVVVAA